MATVKQIIDEFCYRNNIPTKSAYATGTDAASLQYISLLKYIGDYLLGEPFAWAALKRSFLFVTQTNVRNYPLPGDFYKMLESTPWDSSNQWPMRGPISDYNYAVRSLGLVSLQSRKAFRNIGKINGIIHTRIVNEYQPNSQMYLETDPAGDNETNLLQLEYISKNWVLPKNWAYATAYTNSAPDIVNVNGNVYRCITNGTSAANTSIPPTLNNGVGTDGNAQWLHVVCATWTATTAYSVGAYVKTAGGKYYICTEGGTSGGSDPTAETDDVIDGTVTWDYISATAWAANTEYEGGDYVTSGSYLYMNLSFFSDGSTAISGKQAPAWFYNQTTQKWTIPDGAGALVWTWDQQEYTLAADTDIVMFDSDLMVDGMTWSYLRSKGLEYQDARQDWESAIRSAAGRANGPTRINAADCWDDAFENWPLTPIGSWPV